MPRTLHRTSPGDLADSTVRSNLSGIREELQTVSAQIELVADLLTPLLDAPDERHLDSLAEELEELLDTAAAGVDAALEILALEIIRLAGEGA